MAVPTVTNTFVNGNTSDGPSVSQNFTDLINALTDGTKDITINSVTTTANVTVGGVCKLPTGSAAAPSLCGTSFTTTGIYFGTNLLNLSVSGTNVFSQNNVGALTLAPVAGLGTGASAYHHIYGSVVSNCNNSQLGCLTSRNSIFISANEYFDGSGNEKAIATITGYTQLQINQQTASSSIALQLTTNYQDAQTQDAAIVNTSSIVPFSITAGGVVSIGTGTSTQHNLNTLLATNGAQTATLTNLPAAATAGNPNGWLKISINGTTSYIPFWH